MADKLTGTNILYVDEKLRTAEYLVGRLRELRHKLKRGAGAIEAITPQRYARNPAYNHLCIEGWVKAVKVVATELQVIEDELSKRMSQL